MRTSRKSTGVPTKGGVSNVSCERGCISRVIVFVGWWAAWVVSRDWGYIRMFLISSQYQFERL